MLENNNVATLTKHITYIVCICIYLIFFIDLCFYAFNMMSIKNVSKNIKVNQQGHLIDICDDANRGV